MHYKQLTAIIHKEDDIYVSLCPELDIASQGSNIEEAKDNLKEAVELFFESASNKEIIHRSRLMGFVPQPILCTKINFFNSVGQLSIPKRKDWLTTKDGGRSIYSDSISSFNMEENNKHKEWSNQHLDNFDKVISTKLEDWSYENELRLVLLSDFFDYSEKDKRKLKYKFSDLDGIIFGIQTSIEDKIKIINIIRDKCEKESRVDFNFYQAFYNQNNGKIKYSKMDLLTRKAD